MHQQNTHAHNFSTNYQSAYPTTYSHFKKSDSLINDFQSAACDIVSENLHLPDFKCGVEPIQLKIRGKRTRLDFLSDQSGLFDINYTHKTFTDFLNKKQIVRPLQEISFSHGSSECTTTLTYTGQQSSLPVRIPSP